MKKQFSRIRNTLLVIVSPLMMFALSQPAEASTAYGTLNNFDCVNDVVDHNGNGVECHGFEIELDDMHSRDITYTYDYNHYGIPKITEDNSDPAHPKVVIRYAATWTGSAWTAYTAVPSGPITPTDGHQFTNPSVNFGGEHFGAGYYGAPTAVRYHWLIDDGSHNLIPGPPVYIATPTFTYYPPAGGQPLPQVQAAVVPPPPPDPPMLEFGVATWVKDIKTETHNPNKVELRDLVDPDPDGIANDWRNGEPDEVETEWRILQTEFANAGVGNGELEGAPEDLPGGDEVITRRYEFYKYVGPLDPETGEVMTESVGPDDIHGVGDYADVVVVGDFIGAQMAGFDVAPALGLIDHIPDGELNVPYAERTVVVAGGAAFLATTSGSLPDGTALDEITGVFSGTPTAAGAFTFTVEAADTGGALVSKTYTVTISEGAIPPECVTDADCADPDACTTDVCVDGVCEHQPIADCCNADGECDDGDNCTLDACVNHACTHDAVPACCNTDAECADADACTADACVNHACTHDAVPACCNTDAECADADACTADACVNHVCTHDAVPACCNTDAECADADACTTDACVNHVCTHDAVPACCNTDAECADADACTTDACVNHVCTHDAVPACCNTDAECADADACTTDACVNHVCTHDAVPTCCNTDTGCDDGDACTTDRCENAVCTHGEVVDCCRTDADCDDADAGTIDRCVGNLCRHDAVPNHCNTNAQCDDGIACTIDWCVARVCLHIPKNWVCDDGKPCNGREICDPTVGCVQGTPMDCDDGIECTVDTCSDVRRKCLHTPDDSRCDDGLFCNGEERCNAHSGCHSGRKPCPPPFCDEVHNRCRHHLGPGGGGPGDD